MVVTKVHYLVDSFLVNSARIDTFVATQFVDSLVEVPVEVIKEVRKPIPRLVLWPALIFYFVLIAAVLFGALKLYIKLKPV